MQFKRNVPFVARGLGVDQISFSGGRTAASVARHGGLTHINYYGAQRFADVTFYKADAISAWAQLFRPCVAVDGELFYLEFRDTSVYPFGYASHCRCGDVSLAHCMYLLDDAMVFTLTVLANPAGRRLGFKLLLMDCCAQAGKPTRAWNGFRLDAATGAAVATVLDCYPDAVRQPAAAAAPESLTQSPVIADPEPRSAETWIGVTANAELLLRETPASFCKYYFETVGVAGSAVLAVAFGHRGRARFDERLATLTRAAAAEAQHRVGTYQACLAGQPQIVLGNKTVQSLLMNVGPIIDSLKVKDLPGGMRAADSGYWIWGWDSMVHCDALGFAGDTAFLAEMLEFYRRTADPKLGVLHALTLDLRPCLAMAFPAQCLYTILLYHAYLFTGDAKLLAEYLPFARWIVDQAGQDEVPGTGLIRGVSMYPDNPADLEQDGDDLSVFNNSIYYQALRAAAELTREAGMAAAAAQYEARAAQTRAGFRRFYDREKGYFWDSLSARDLSPRRHYPVYAILWLTTFARDLVSHDLASIAGFMRENFTARHGLRMLPKWDPRFMHDGNQLGMYMPVTEPFYRQMMKETRDADSGAAMLEHMAWFWSRLCVPEALTCECENHGITVDNPGRKQAFCGKAWLAMFYHVLAGLELDIGGVSLSPGDGPDITIRNLRLRGKRIDLAIRGRGWQIGSLTLNGIDLGAARRIPFADLGGHNRIVVRRA